MDSMPSPDGSSPRPRRSQLARCRWLNGLTQRQLAELAGVGRASIVRAEAGASVPTLRTASRLARALGEPIPALFPDLAERALEQARMRHKAPAVVTVSVEDLRAFRVLTDPQLHAARRCEAERVSADLDRLVYLAEQAARPL